MERPHRRLRSEEGLGLVELMISILLIGMILMGLATSLVTSLQAIRIAEKASLATAVHQEVLERDVALPWQYIGIELSDPDYEPEVNEEGKATPFDTVGLPDDARIQPRKQVITRENVDFNITRDIYWVDEAKRIRTTISWTEGGDTATSVFYAMRLPTALELDGEFDVLLFQPSPNVVQLDASKLTTTDVTFTVNVSQPSSAPIVTYESEDGTSQTVTGWTQNAYATSWTATLTAGAGPFASGDQLIDLEVTSATSPPETQKGTVTVTFVADGDTAPDANFEILEVSAASNPGLVDKKSSFCSNQFTVRVDGFTSADTVELEYEYWTATRDGNTTTYQRTNSARVQATHVTPQSGDVATFTYTHTGGAGEAYLADETITITAVATRQDSTLSKSKSFTLPLQYVTTVNEQCP